MGGEFVLDDTLNYGSEELEKDHEECQKLISRANVAPAVIEYSSNESELDDNSTGYGVHDNGGTQSMNLSSFTGDDDSCSSYDQESLDTRYVDDGIEYMSVAEDTMMRQYIFLQENCDESWFPTSEVVEEIRRFVKYQSNCQEKHKCAKRRAKLKDILDELEVAVKNKRVKSEFLNDVFSRFYETEEGLS